MFLSKKKDEDLDEIRRAIEKAEPPHEEETVPTVRSKDSGAPLFVKVDKYREILTGVQEMKLFVSSVKQLFTVLNETDHIRKDAFNTLRATVQRLERSLSEMDVELLRPRGVNLSMDQEAEDVHHIETSLEDLQRQLKELRRELDGTK